MWVKRTQILAAKNGRLFEFLMCCHPSSFKREGNSLRLQSNRSISVKRGYYGYLDFSTGETGDGIDLLVRHLGYTFQDEPGLRNPAASERVVSRRFSFRSVHPILPQSSSTCAEEESRRG